MRYRCPNPRTILVIEMTPPLIRVPSPCLPDHPVAVKAVTEEPIGTMVDHVTLRDEMRNFIHGINEKDDNRYRGFIEAHV